VETWKNGRSSRSTSTSAKVELGSCSHPYGTRCQHEHACLRCAQLHVNPKMLPLPRRIGIRPGTAEGTRIGGVWLGEIDGVDLTLQCLRDKRAAALRLARITRQVDLGMPPSAQPDDRTRRSALSSRLSAHRSGGADAQPHQRVEFGDAAACRTAMQRWPPSVSSAALVSAPVAPDRWVRWGDPEAERHCWRGCP